MSKTTSEIYTCMLIIIIEMSAKYNYSPQGTVSPPHSPPNPSKDHNLSTSTNPVYHEMGNGSMYRNRLHRFSCWNSKELQLKCQVRRDHRQSHLTQGFEEVLGGNRIFYDYEEHQHVNKYSCGISSQQKL